MNTVHHTSIMATVTLERCTPQFLTSLQRLGMEAVRINSAHVSPEELTSMIETIRRHTPDIKILMDTKGPEIRTTEVSTPIDLSVGQRVKIMSGTDISTQDVIYVNVPEIHSCAAAGMDIMIDDGDISLTINGVEDKTIQATVTKAATLNSRKTVAIPGAVIPHLPAVSERDRENIYAARKAGIDMIAHSFVRNADDVHAVRDCIEGSDIMLYSKIECREALDNLMPILEASDGLLVARGDLGTQVPLSEIPAIQYRILSLCRHTGKPSIVATQILQSMISSPTPTRAEVNDVALAVMEGADTLLLCGETAVGDYPEKCVEIMHRTIESVTRHSLSCRIY